MTDPAPVCLLEPDIKIDQPIQRPWPAVPNAHDLPSALAAINALRNIINQLLNLLAQNNRLRPPAGGGTSGTGSKGATKVGKYSEVNRQTRIVRVFNPQDKTQYVDVEQIYGLNFQDNKTGEKWAWTR